MSTLTTKDSFLITVAAMFERRTLPRDTRNSLVGTWQLVSVKFELTDSGESMDMYGPEPLGYFILTAEGRLMVPANRRKNDADNASLFKSMLAYSGHCRVLDDNRFVTNVDVAWHPAWMNTEQTRAFEIDGDLLSVSTVGMVHPNFPGRTGQAVVRWRRMSAKVRANGVVRRTVAPI
jgi:hypothetical protein